MSLRTDGTNGQAIKAVRERFPETYIVATLALVVEATKNIMVDRKLRKRCFYP